MNDSYKILSVNNIQNMSISDIVSAYRGGYRLDTNIQRLDISTWLNTDACFGTDPNQICIKNGYMAVIGGIVLLVLLTR